MYLGINGFGLKKQNFERSCEPIYFKNMVIVKKRFRKDRELKNIGHGHWRILL